jgi:hypothetical protein
MKTSYVPTHNGYLQWLEQQDYGLAVTLNFKPRTKPHQAVIHARKFWNAIDRAVFGANAVKRHNQRLNRVCVLEGVTPASYVNKMHSTTHDIKPMTTNTTCAITHLPARSASFASANPHYHCAIKTTGDISYHHLGDLLTNAWNHMRCAGRFSEIKPIHMPERGKWLSYILKHANHDAICLHTSTLRDPSPLFPARDITPDCKYGMTYEIPNAYQPAP